MALCWMHVSRLPLLGHLLRLTIASNCNLLFLVPTFRQPQWIHQMIAQLSVHLVCLLQKVIYLFNSSLLLQHLPGRSPSLYPPPPPEHIYTTSFICKSHHFEQFTCQGLAYNNQSTDTPITKLLCGSEVNYSPAEHACECLTCNVLKLCTSYKYVDNTDQQTNIYSQLACRQGRIECGTVKAKNGKPPGQLQTPANWLSYLVRNGIHIIELNHYPLAA